MLKNRNGKLKKTYLCIDEGHTYQDDIDSENTQEKKLELTWCTHSFINKFNEFTKFCKANFVFYAH